MQLKINLSVPLVVRLAGTNFKEGKSILDKSNLKILSASDLNDAAKKSLKQLNKMSVLINKNTSGCQVTEHTELFTLNKL